MPYKSCSTWWTLRILLIFSSVRGLGGKEEEAEAGEPSSVCVKSRMRVMFCESSEGVRFPTERG